MPAAHTFGPASAGFFFQSNFGEAMTNERTLRQDAIRGAIIGGLAFLGIAVVASLIIWGL
jgi:hypothetical protein